MQDAMEKPKRSMRDVADTELGQAAWDVKAWCALVEAAEQRRAAAAAKAAKSKGKGKRTPTAAGVLPLRNGP